MQGQNIFKSPKAVETKELETTLLAHPKAQIKKIVSPANFKSEIFCQDIDEWACLIQGEASLQVDGIIHSLKKGDWIYIGANTKHQITNTSTEPLAVWLAIYL